MDDFERYGDYNEVDEPPSKSKVGIVIKGLIFALCIAVVGFVAFRLIIFNHYPDSVKNIYFNDELTELYNSKGTDIGALTQGLLDSRNYGYDDAREGNFFCKYMIYIPEAEQLQVTVRYNVSLMESIKEKYGVELDPDSENNFSYRLVAMRSSDEADEGAEDSELGTPLDAELVATVQDSALMYRYAKLVFDGVDLNIGTDDEIDWIRLEILINGVENAEPYMVLIYYNTESFPLVPYKLSSKEKPQ